MGTRTRTLLLGHWAMMRADHWFKNVFMLPGTVVAVSLLPTHLAWQPLKTLAALGALCLTASSYYTLNELLDAPYDLHHPEKKTRPVPSGQVSVGLGWVQWLLLGAASFLMGWRLVSIEFAATQVVLWVMACLYNIPPIRTKNVAYLDVLSESINNPLRMVAGWYVVDNRLLPPASLLMAYWLIGGYFMTLKRYAEFRAIGNKMVASAYRASFEHYSENGLLSVSVFYASASMICLGAFIVRYRLELLLGFPFLGFVIATYFHEGLKRDSAVQNPERLYRVPSLMVAVGSCVTTLTVLMFVDLPWLHRLLKPQISI